MRRQLQNSSIRLIVRRGFKPSDVNNLKLYIEQNQIFEIVVSSTITRSKHPNAAIAQFLAEINKLVSRTTVKESYTPHLYPDATWAKVDKLKGGG